MINESLFKTKFEKYSSKVIKCLQKKGVDTEKYLAVIMNAVVDFFDEIDPNYAAQCIKHEIESNHLNKKCGFVREAAEFDDAKYEYIDQVLDCLDKYSEPEVYQYFSEHRDEIPVDLQKDPMTVSEMLDNSFYNDSDEEEAATAISDLDDIYKSDKFITHPTGADGKWATKDFPISFAIAENDVATLEEYFETGIPARLLSDDEEDEEVISWEEQYSQEFERDYSLLTSKVAIEHNDINDSLRFMLEKVEDFIVSPFDLYNLFASSKTDDMLLKELADNYTEASDPDELYVDGNTTVSDLIDYLNN